MVTLVIVVVVIVVVVGGGGGVVVVVGGSVVVVDVVDVVWGCKLKQVAQHSCWNILSLLHRFSRSLFSSVHLI